MMRRWLVYAAFLVLLLLTLGAACGAPASGTAGTTAAASGTTIWDSGDAELAQAFADRATDLEVLGTGIVTKLLSDDTQGDRHQRFIVRLASGQTLLVTHNIDIAPRVAVLEVGDTISFKGVYEWNNQGGLIHWTHADPDGTHEAGWVKHEGHVYQ